MYFVLIMAKNGCAAFWATFHKLVWSHECKNAKQLSFSEEEKLSEYCGSQTLSQWGRFSEYLQACNRNKYKRERCLQEL
jgi:hypothetical protein